MSQVISPQLLLGILIWMGLTIVFGALTSWIWAIRRLASGESILPEEPLLERRKLAWGWGLLLVLVAFVLVNVGGFAAYSLATRGRHSQKPVEVKKALPNKTDTKKGDAAANKDHPADQTPAPVASKRPSEADQPPGNLSWVEMMFVQAAINSTLIVLLPLILRVVSGARLVDLGLGLRAWRRQVAIGIVGIVMVMPVVQIVNWFSTYLPGLPRQEARAHPLEKMLRDDPTGSIAYLAVLSAVLLAPVSEELLFRGILQPWLIAALNDLVLALRGRRREWTSVLEGPPAEFEFRPVDEPDGSSKISLNTPVSEPVRASTDGEPTPYHPPVPTATAAAIVLISLLFGALHSPQWPAPIPIFVLALGLGIVSYRTGSLLSPICMHAIFNGVSTVGILLTLHSPVQRPAHPVEPAAGHAIPREKAPVGPPGVDRGPQRGKSVIPGSSSWTPTTSTVRVWVSCETLDWDRRVGWSSRLGQGFFSIKARGFRTLAVNAGPGNDR